MTLVVASATIGRADDADEPQRHSSVTLYGGLFGNKDYVQAWEGVSASIGVLPRLALLGRITGIHVIDSDRFREGSSGIGEGGLGFTIARNTSISVLGGTYFGDIDDPIIDGSFDTAVLFGDRWVSFSAGGLYGFSSNRWQATGYVATPVTDPHNDLTLFAGADTIIYNEGRFRSRDGNDFVHNPNSEDVKFQAGPNLTLYMRPWEAGLRLGVGGGDYGVYGTGSIWKTFSF
jgi:hypothetical protein